MKRSKIIGIIFSSETDAHLNECQSELSQLQHTFQALEEQLSILKVSYEEAVEWQTSLSKIDTELATKQRVIEDIEKYIEVN
jgi:hypothetical protein